MADKRIPCLVYTARCVEETGIFHPVLFYTAGHNQNQEQQSNEKNTYFLCRYFHMYLPFLCFTQRTLVFS